MLVKLLFFRHIRIEFIYNTFACIVLYYEFKKMLPSISIFEFAFKDTKQIMQVEGKSH